LLVPSGFFELLKDLGVRASRVVVNCHGFEFRFDEFYESGVGEDFGLEAAASCSSRNFLEQEEQGLPGLFGGFD